MNRLDHVQGMIGKVNRLCEELYIEYNPPRIVPGVWGHVERSRFDQMPRSRKAVDAHSAKHLKLKRLIKELFVKHGEFMKENNLTRPTFDGKIVTRNSNS